MRHAVRVGISLAAGLSLLAAVTVFVLLHAGGVYGVFSDTEALHASLVAGSVETPSDLTCRFLSFLGRELAWSPAAGGSPEGYRIYHNGPFWHDDFELLDQVAAPATTYDDVWPSFFRHRWYVTAFLGSWESSASDVIEVHCRPAIHFPGPCDLDGENHHSERVVGVTWEPAADAVLYGVFRAEQGGGPYEMVGTTANTTYEDQAVRDGVTYYYVVVAVDEQGNESDPSLEIAVPDSVPGDSPTATPTTELTPTPVATTTTDTPQSTATGTPTPEWMIGPDLEPGATSTPTWMIGPQPGPTEEAPAPEPSEEPAALTPEATATPTPTTDPSAAPGSDG